MHSVHTSKGRRSWFEGWYFKQQSEEETVALIPAFHADASGRASASLQVITGDGARRALFPASAFCPSRGRFPLRLGDCVFSSEGCALRVDQEGCKLRGELRFGPLTPPAYDIMGPFRFVPCMQCRHSVGSLYHRVNGWLDVEGRRIEFCDGGGYLEGDRGSSFPSRYVWTQCTWGQSCILLSVADVPLGVGSIKGALGCVFVGGKERRIATYLGARVLEVRDGGVTLRQGRLTVRAELLRMRAHLLRAPVLGDMSRSIRESVACCVRYTAHLDRETLFDFISDRASFEGNWDSRGLSGS